MANTQGWCLSCDEIFSRESGESECTSCGSSMWVPHQDPNTQDTRDTSIDGEFSGSKSVDEWEFRTLERAEPCPNVQELRIETEDEWQYLFREPNPNEGYELHRKQRPDGEYSDDDVVPVEVAEYIDSMVTASLNYTKLIVHPGIDVYEPPKN